MPANPSAPAWLSRQDGPLQTAEGRWGPAAKRAEDLVLGTALLVLVLPLMAAIAVAIRLDTPGPALFRQTRRGLNNRPFDILKFRTMVFVPGPELTVPQAQRHNPRVTRVGRVLRRTSLDELPQLFNVLRGEMSLVGPRPHALAHGERYGSLIAGYPSGANQMRQSLAIREHSQRGNAAPIQIVALHPVRTAARVGVEATRADCQNLGCNDDQGAESFHGRCPLDPCTVNLTG
jgi:hypothetical protein